MCGIKKSINEIDRELMKIDERFEYLYGEKIYHISKRERQTLSTGYQPDERGCFKLCIRFQDNRYGNVLTLSLFQFVRLMKDVRDVIFTAEEVERLDEVDATIKFRFSEINVPTVLIEVDGTVEVPNLFQLVLHPTNSILYNTIVLSRKTLRKLCESEESLIGTVEAIQDKSCNFMFKTFVTKCVDHLEANNTPIESSKMFNEIKSLSKTPYQCEMFLKFWPLISSLVTRKMRSARQTSV